MTKQEKAERAVLVAAQIIVGFDALVEAIYYAGYWAHMAHNPPPYNPDPRVRGIVD